MLRRAASDTSQCQSGNAMRSPGAAGSSGEQTLYVVLSELSQASCSRSKGNAEGRLQHCPKVPYAPAAVFDGAESTSLSCSAVPKAALASNTARAPHPLTASHDKSSRQHVRPVILISKTLAPNGCCKVRAEFGRGLQASRALGPALAQRRSHCTRLGNSSEEKKGDPQKLSEKPRPAL